MNVIGERLREMRVQNARTQEEVAKFCGVSRNAVTLWEAGNSTPTVAHLFTIAGLFGTTVSSLLGEEEKSRRGRRYAPRNTRSIKLITYHQAALWDEKSNPSGKRATEFVHADTSVGKSAFALRIDDRSMEPEIRPDDIVIIDPDVPPTPGDFVVARLDGVREALLRKFRPKAALPTEYPEVELVPLNEDWPSVLIEVNGPGRVVGPVVELRRPYSNCRSFIPQFGQTAASLATPATRKQSS